MSDFNRSFGIILGINAYQNGVPKLSTAAADAEMLNQILKDKHGYECLLRVDQEVTLNGLKKLLDEDLPQMVTKDDRVLFYFAGHGVATNGDDGPEGYLLPQDARLDDDRTFLQMTELNQSLCALQCRHMLVILDCCFAGAFRWSSIRTLRPAPKVIHREQYEYFVKDPAWQAIASSAYDQTAIDKRHETDKH
ncbi:MAG TPA: caspase family protein, partial [Pyrinomonadaceae bacterium]|nr:caspase family protein [Pyrinomonadaceae bacterium]